MMFSLRSTAQSAEHDNRVAVIGLGRFGSALASTLHSHGIEVLAVDISPKRVQALAEELPHLAVVDSTDREALEQVGIPEFSHVVVAIGSDIESSVITTSLLDEFGVADIWAKAITSQHGRILQRVGAHHLVSPEAETGQRLAHLVTGYLTDFQSFAPDIAIAELSAPASLLNTPLTAHAVFAQYGVHLMALRRATGQLDTDAEPFTLGPQDRLVVWAAPDLLRQMAAKVRRRQ